MSDNREAAEAAWSDSTVLEPRQNSENSLSDAAFVAPEKEEKPKEEAKPAPSSRSAIEKTLDNLEAKEKAAEKPEKAETAEKDEPEAEKPKEEGKAEKAEKSAAPEKDDAGTGQDGEKKPRQSEGRQFHEPPARFLPKAKEDWRNVPYAVKSEVARLTQEHETELSQYRQSHEEYTKLAKFTDMAKRHNTTVDAALEAYTTADQQLHQDFGRGVAGLAQQYGHQPAQAIAMVLRGFGVTPQQYAQHVAQNPQSHQAPEPQRAPDPMQRQTASEVQELRAQLDAMKTENAARQIIDPFRADHPRYDELQDDIAFFLSSGKIPTSLPPHERLEAAYDMAVRINPASSVEPPRARDEPVDADSEPAVDPRGQKSVRGAPATGIDPSRTRRVKNNRDAASAALSALGI